MPERHRDPAGPGFHFRRGRDRRSSLQRRLVRPGSGPGRHRQRPRRRDRPGTGPGDERTRVRPDRPSRVLERRGGVRGERGFVAEARERSADIPLFPDFDSSGYDPGRRYRPDFMHDDGDGTDCGALRRFQFPLRHRVRPDVQRARVRFRSRPVPGGRLSRDRHACGGARPRGSLAAGHDRPGLDRPRDEERAVRDGGLRG
jgi:hypothetical protein